MNPYERLAQWYKRVTWLGIVLNMTFVFPLMFAPRFALEILQLDVEPLISGSDLSQTIECHSGTAVCDPLFKAVGVSYASGAPSTDQTVFRLK